LLSWAGDCRTGGRCEMLGIYRNNRFQGSTMSIVFSFDFQVASWISVSLPFCIVLFNATTLKKPSCYKCTYYSHNMKLDIALRLSHVHGTYPVVLWQFRFVIAMMRTAYL
jgi:hypothetical protein